MCICICKYIHNVHVCVYAYKSKIFFFKFTKFVATNTSPPPSSCMRAQSYDPKDCSLPDSSLHGLFQARILEWVAISFSSQRFLSVICTDLINKKRKTEINFEMWDDRVTEFIRTFNVKTSFQKYINRYVCI